MFFFYDRRRLDMDTRYQIGDKLHCYVYSDYNFEIEVEVMAISNLELASEEENILRKLFNSETAYQDVVANTSYYYICKVLKATVDYAVDDKIVLCDAIIKPETYYIERSFRLIIDITYNTYTTSFRTIQEIINGIANYLDTNNLTNTITQGKTELEQKEEELNRLRDFLNDVKGLQAIQPTLDNLMRINDIDIYNRLNTQMLILISMVTNLIKTLDENSP